MGYPLKKRLRAHYRKELPSGLGLSSGCLDRRY